MGPHPLPCHCQPRDAIVSFQGSSYPPDPHVITRAGPPVPCCMELSELETAGRLQVSIASAGNCMAAAAFTAFAPILRLNDSIA